MRLYPRMAGQNIVRQRRFFYPYLLTVIGTVAAFYIICAGAFRKCDSIQSIDNNCI